MEPVDPQRTLDLEEADRVEPARAFAPGFTVGHFRIVREIGAGGMGIVFEAYDPDLDRRVAIKVVRDVGAGSAAGTRLIREAQAMAKLAHPNVVAVHEVGTIDGQVFLVMELVPGDTLAAWLETPRPWREIVHVFLAAGEGLAAAHHAGIVHRDFKPGNVLIDRNARVRVSDFGLARSDAEAAMHLADGSDGPRLVVGTPGYMAPEQRAGDEVDARADQYAFAVSLQQALKPKRVIGKVPRRVRAAIARSLEIDPDSRFGTMDDLLAQLRRALGARKRWLVGAALAVSVAGGAGAMAATLGHSAIDDCAKGSGLVESVWNRDAKLAQARAFHAVHGDEATIATAARLVDQWSESWRLGRNAACHADRPQRVARVACLDRALGELRAQVAVWQAADRSVVDHAVAAAAALPAPGSCAEHAVAPKVVIAPLNARIAELEALDRSGKAAAAQPKIPAVLADAEASKDPETIGRAMLVAGMIERDLGALAASREHLARAAQEAGAAGDDHILGEALVFEAIVAGDQGRPLDGLGIMDAANAIAVRGYERPERIALVRGESLRDAGRTPEAITELERAVAMLEQKAAREPAARIDLASALGGLASAYENQRNYAKSIELEHRTLAIEEADLGPNHPEVGKTIHDLGNAELRTGKYAEAEAHYRRAKDVFTAAYGPKHPLVAESDISLANLALQQNKDDDAEKLYGLALEELGGLSDDHPDRAIVEEALGSIARDRDRCKDAIPHFERARMITDKVGRTGPEQASLFVNLGACYADVGRDDEARSVLDRASELFATAHVPDTAYAELWALTADLEAKAGHRAKAIELAQHVMSTTSDDQGPAYVQLRQYERQQLAAWNKR